MEKLIPVYIPQVNSLDSNATRIYRRISVDRSHYIFELFLYDPRWIYSELCLYDWLKILLQNKSYIDILWLWLLKRVNIEQKDFYNAKIEERGLAIIIHFVCILFVFHETTPYRYKYPQASILIYQCSCDSLLRSSS